MIIVDVSGEGEGFGKSRMRGLWEEIGGGGCIYGYEVDYWVT